MTGHGSTYKPDAPAKDAVAPYAGRLVCCMIVHTDSGTEPPGGEPDAALGEEAGDASFEIGVVEAGHEPEQRVGVAQILQAVAIDLRTRADHQAVVENLNGGIVHVAAAFRGDLKRPLRVVLTDHVEQTRPNALGRLDWHAVRI